jgi:hypothetical protein
LAVEPKIIFSGHASKPIAGTSAGNSMASTADSSKLSMLEGKSPFSGQKQPVEGG